VPGNLTNQPFQTVNIPHQLRLVRYRILSSDKKESSQAAALLSLTASGAEIPEPPRVRYMRRITITYAEVCYLVDDPTQPAKGLAGETPRTLSSGLSLRAVLEEQCFAALRILKDAL
jgi:hypothetical protein